MPGSVRSDICYWHWKRLILHMGSPRSPQEGVFTQASDIFAVGVTAYILCSRKFPFQHKVFDDKPGENYVGSPKMHEIADKVRKSALNWDSDFKDKAMGCDFCKQLMNFDPEQRPSAEEALEHPWLDEGPAVGKALSMF
eukprot:g9699.t1